MEPTGVDPRDIITPEAFKVDPELLGLPLATPKRRAAALLLDLTLAAILAELGGFLIGIAVAFVFFRVATRRALDHPLKRWARASFAVTGAFVLFITALVVVGEGNDDDDDDDIGANIVTIDGAAIDWSAMGDSANAQGFAEAMAAFAQLAGDSAEVENTVAEITKAVMETFGAGPALPDSLGPEERTQAAALLRTYATALADDAQPTLDSLREQATTLVAGTRLRQLHAQIQQRQQRIDELEEDNERLADKAAHPSLKRIAQATADDFGLTIGWFGLYFTLFLTWWHGHTPGKRLLGLQVVRLNGKPITLWIAFERFGGYAAGVATGLLGFFQVFWDPNRQGIHDRIAGTAVIRKKKA
ncbi:MAG: RDD family protein [Bacteroidetes bacterium]|nr:RDD family protein [Bacteroidota bacterium]